MSGAGGDGAGDGLPFGWPLADLERMCASAATRHRSTWLSWEERRVCAADGVLDALYGAAERPGPGELANAAHAAIQAEEQNVLRCYGIFRDGGARFGALWIGTLRCYAAGFEERYTDRIAVHQVWDQMREYDREPLRHLVEEETYEAAARVMRLPARRYQHRLARARKHARVLWFAPETAPGLYARDYRGRRGTRSNDARTLAAFLTGRARRAKAKAAAGD